MILCCCCIRIFVFIRVAFFSFRNRGEKTELRVPGFESDLQRLQPTTLTTALPSSSKEEGLSIARHGAETVGKFCCRVPLQIHY